MLIDLDTLVRLAANPAELKRLLAEQPANWTSWLAQVAGEIALGRFEVADALLSDHPYVEQLPASVRLLEFWLEGETQSPSAALNRLNRWLTMQEWHRRCEHEEEAFPQTALKAADQTLALRCAPALQLYLLTLLAAWTVEQRRLFEQTVDILDEAKLPELLTLRLNILIRLALARMDDQPAVAAAALAEWVAQCTRRSDLGSGEEWFQDMLTWIDALEQPERALVWIDQFLKAGLPRLPLLLLAARLQKDLGRLAESLKHCDDILAEFPDQVETLCLRSNLHYLGGRPDAARADAETALRLSPDDPSALLARGFARLQAEEYPTARLDLEAVLRLVPEHYDARRGRAKCLVMMGQEHEALADLMRLHRLWPEDVELVYDLADAYLTAGYAGESERAARECLRLDPAMANAYVLLAINAMRRGREEEARQQIAEALRLEPENPFALNEAASISLLTGDDETALEQVRLALSLVPHYVEAWSTLGSIEYYRGQFEESAEAYRRAVELAPEFSEAWIGRGNALAQLGETDLAQGLFDRALELDPGNAEACLGKALAFRISGLEDEARRWQEKAAELSPDRSD